MAVEVAVLAVETAGKPVSEPAVMADKLGLAGAVTREVTTVFSFLRVFYAFCHKNVLEMTSTVVLF